MALIPRGTQVLGAHRFLMIGFCRYATGILQNNVGIKAIYLCGRCSGNVRGAICAQPAKIIIEGAVLLQHEDDVLDRIWANGLGRRHTNYNFLGDGPARSAGRGGVGSGGNWRDGYRSGRKFGAYVTDTVINLQRGDTYRGPAQDRTLSQSDRIRLGGQIELHGGHGNSYGRRDRAPGPDSR